MHERHGKRNRNHYPPPFCSVAGCGRKHRSKGFCHSHYQMWRKRGSTEPLHTPPGTALQWLIENQDFSSPQCLAWPFGRNSGGYAGSIRINGKAVPACHWLLIARGYARPSPRHEALHSCGNGHEACVNPNHLRWGTRQENANDKIAHGNSSRGQQHWSSNFTDDDVRQIKRRILAGASSVEIARDFGVSRKTIGGIREGRTWAWLEAGDGA